MWRVDRPPSKLALNALCPYSTTILVYILHDEIRHQSGKGLDDTGDNTLEASMTMTRKKEKRVKEENQQLEFWKR